MKIRGLGCAMPQRVVKNDEVLAMVEEQTRPWLDGSTEKVLGNFRLMLRRSGTLERRWRAPGERANDFAKAAVAQALQRAEMRPEDIDLLIYVGVGRGWVEPGMATYFAQECGLSRATGFDILDACLSWMRALHIADQFLRNGVYRRIMVLNAEFNRECGDFGIRDLSEVAFRFAQLTIGESATATILTGEDCGIEPCFVFKTDPARHDLCKIPLPNIAAYNDRERCPRLDPFVFFAYSSDLMVAAQELIPDLYFGTPELQRRTQHIVVAHSASIPTSMAISLDEGRLKPGMNMLMIMGSAGFSAGICHMKY